MIKDLNQEEFPLKQNEIKNKINSILQNIIKLIEFYSTIGRILDVQRKLSPYPFIDKFLKMFWSYFESIKDLSK